MANHIAHFEIFASDVERARRFYEQVFGWRFEVGGPPDLARELILFLCGAPPASQRGTPVEIIAAEIGGASLRTFERLFVEATGLSLAPWRRQSRLLTSLSLLAERQEHR